MIEKSIKAYADSGDLISLKYVFVDALDIDPTFERYRDSYDYCRSVPGLMEDYRELTPLTEDRSLWTEDYWVKLKTDLAHNFSDKRMRHMCQVAQVLMAEKVRRLTQERQRPAPSAPPEARPAPTPTPAPAPAPVAAPSGEEEQRRQLEEARRRLEEENRRVKAEQDAQEKRLQEEREKYAVKQAPRPASPTSSKKWIGIAIAAAAVIIAVIIAALLLHRSPDSRMNRRDSEEQDPPAAGLMM